MKKLLCTALLLCMCIAPLAAPAAGGFQGLDAPFSTPEDAISYLVEAVAAQDTARVLAVSCAEEVGQGYDYTAVAENIGSVPAMESALLPDAYGVYRQMNELSVANDFLMELISVYSSFAPFREVREWAKLSEQPTALEDRLVQLNPDQFAGLTVVRIDLPRMSGSGTPAEIWDRLQPNFRKQAALYGADDGTERVALLDLDGQLYYQGFTLRLYGESWHISSMLRTSELAPGVLIPTTEEEYLEYIMEVRP